MSSTNAWILAGSILLLIIFITFGIGWWLRNQTPTAAPLSPYNDPLGWSKPVPSNDSTKNTCQLYEFPTTKSSDLIIPGTPTFNTNLLNNLQGQNVYPTCLDTDQIIAQQVTHTCIAPQGVLDGQITLCNLQSGGTTGLNGTETFYTNSLCPAINACPGTLSVVSLNFQTTTPPSCIQNNGPGVNATMSLCDPSQTNQLYRVTRINPGQNPNSLQPGLGQNGIVSQIYDRNNNLCLTSGSSDITIIYDGSYNGTGCSGTESRIGTNVIMSSCTGMTGSQAPGYVWLMLPSTLYCKSQNVCTITPPQIAYIGNINLTNMPTVPSDRIQWLLDNNVKSLYWGGSGNALGLLPLATDISQCDQKPYTAQYLSIPSYNTLISTTPCSYSTSTPCTSF